MWTDTCTIERGAIIGVLVQHIPPPIKLLTPQNTTSPGQHVWFTQPGQVPKAGATLTSKDQCTSVILIQGEDLPIQVPTKYLSF